MRNYSILLAYALILFSCNSNKETIGPETYRNDYYSFRYNSEWIINESQSPREDSNLLHLPPYLSLTNPLLVGQEPSVYRFTGGIIEIYIEFTRPGETVQSLTQRLPVSLFSPTGDLLKQQKETELGLMGTGYTASTKGSHGEDISSQGFWFIREVNDNPLSGAIAYDIRLSIFNPQEIDENTKKGYINTYIEILNSFELLK